MNRAWANHNQQTPVAAVEDVHDLLTEPMYRGRSVLGDRQFLLEERRWQQDLGPLDSQIVGSVHGLNLRVYQEER
jgi:hypothetical protein